MTNLPNHPPALRRVGCLLAAIVFAAFPVVASEPGSPAGADVVPKPSMPTESSASSAADRALGSERAAAAGRPLDLDAAVRIALAENPVLRAAGEGVAAAGEAIGIAQAAYFPEVGLDSRYRRFDTHVFLPSGLPAEDTTLGATDDWSAGFKVGYSLYDSGSVGVALQLPIFSGFAKTHRVERATLEAKILEAEAEALANRVGQEVWAASSDLASAAEAVLQTAELKAEAEQSWPSPARGTRRGRARSTTFSTPRAR